ncbi:Uma2 family endonuclease [Streptomyces sp. T028]|uniref:Uma2 family endonuclease n=1 Tax=Streptomyces sp. T028 TaxID=3394379 RepID=UPI003A88CF78
MSEYFGDYIQTDDAWDEVVWVWRHTDVPKGCRAEIIDGLISVTPLSAGGSPYIASRVTRALYKVVPDGWGVYQWLGTAVPDRLSLYVPDLVVMPRERDRVDSHYVPAAEARLAVEITSKATAHNDRVSKAAGYALAGVPLYLLIDALAPEGPTVSLYGEPQQGAYRLLSACRFGDVIRLPEPFGLKLDTSEFPTE